MITETFTLPLKVLNMSFHPYARTDDRDIGDAKGKIIAYKVNVERANEMVRIINAHPALVKVAEDATYVMGCDCPGIDCGELARDANDALKEIR